MAQAIGNILPLAVGVAISPVPMIAIVLMLGTPRARVNGLAFTLGWLVGLAVVGTVVLVLANGHADASSGGPATWVSILKLVLGLLFLLIAVKQWRSRPTEGEEPEMPKWMQAIDTFTAGKSFGGGAVLSGVNPKNFALTLAAGAAISETGISGGEQAVALAVFVLVGSLTILAPVVVYFAMGERAVPILDGLKTWMARNNATIMAVLLVVLGAKLIGDAIAGFGS